MLRTQIMDEMKVAMKAHDSTKLNVLRYMLSEIKNREIDAKHELSDPEVVEILRREVKRRSESIEQFKQGNRMDLATQEETELAIINGYLPQQMGEAEIEAVVTSVMERTGSKEFGIVMKEVMAELKGRADGSLVSSVVRAKLQ